MRDRHLQEKPLRVGELIEVLKQWPDNTEIEIVEEGCGGKDELIGWDHVIYNTLDQSLEGEKVLQLLIRSCINGRANKDCRQCVNGV